MYYTELTNYERSVKRWRIQRNHIVSKILSSDPHILSYQALKLANSQMPPCPKPPRQYTHKKWSKKHRRKARRHAQRLS